MFLTDTLRHLALAFLLSAELFFISPWALPPAFIVNNTVSVNKPHHNFIYSKQSFYYLCHFCRSGIQEGGGFARHPSHSYGQDPGWSWEEGRGLLGIGWLSLHGVSGQKLRDREKYSILVLQRWYDHALKVGISHDRHISLILTGINSLFNLPWVFSSFSLSLPSKYNFRILSLGPQCSCSCSFKVPERHAVIKII